jgi:FKBP-type peptidyl-prolyl cis-trans isomerase FklB
MPTLPRCFPRLAGALVLLLLVAPHAPAQTPDAGANRPAAASPDHVVTGSAAGPAASPAAPSSPEEASYLLGLTLGNQLKHAGLAGRLVFDQLTRGVRDGLGDAPLTNAQRTQATQFMRAARDTLADQNRAQAQEFLARNATRAGVRKTPSGLEYQVLGAGNPGARPPRMTDQVTVHYRATLLDGTTFDSSDAHSEPATFRMNSMLKGWQEALMMMTPGAKWQLWVPPELAYDSHPPPGIPPGALVIYELELEKVEAPPASDMRRTEPHASPQPGAPQAPAAGAVKH